MGEDFVYLKCEKQEKVLVVLLNRPEKSNAINKRLLGELERTLENGARDEEIGVVVLSSEGKHFSVGADIEEVKDFRSVADYENFFSRIQGCFNTLDSLPKPTIAAVNGFALGAGFELSLATDLRIAADDAAFALPEVKLGAIPGAGGTQRLPRIVGESRALEMIYSGDPIRASDAYRIGLVNKVVPPRELLEEAIRFARRLASRPPVALRTAKRLVKQGRNMELGAALEFEAKSAVLVATTEDQREGFRAFLEKRDPKFVGR
jgi:enoyl-CoA hydratase/carnithine racemase